MLLCERQPVMVIKRTQKKKSQCAWVLQTDIIMRKQTLCLELQKQLSTQLETKENPAEKDQNTPTHATQKSARTPVNTLHYKLKFAVGFKPNLTSLPQPHPYEKWV